MRLTLRSMLALLACSFALCLIAPRAAKAEQGDPIAAALDKARVKYENAMADVRNGVEAAIESQVKASETDGKKADNRFEKAREAFKRDGKLPLLTETTKFKEAASETKKEMSNAYTTASVMYAEGKEDQRRAAIVTESEQFGLQNDLVPWEGNLLEKETEPSRTLDAAEEALTVEIGLQGEYRIEILGKRLSETGTLFVALPMPDGKRLEVPAVVGKGGKVHVLLSVCAGIVSADLGVTRPIALGEPIPGEGTAAALRAEGGGFKIESVRVKPIVAIVREQATVEKRQISKQQDKPIPSEKQKRKRTDQKEPSKHEDLLPLGASGEGDCIHHAGSDSSVRVQVTVDRRDRDQLELRVVLVGTGESFLVRCATHGSKLIVTNVEQTKPPRGKAPFMVTKTTGGSGVIRNKILNLSWVVRGNSPGLGNNREWTVQLQDVAIQ